MNQQTYLKVPFVWEEHRPLIEVPQRLTFKPVNAMHGNQLISIVVRVWASSMNPSHQRKVSEPEPHQAVERYLSSASDDFSYQDSWWQFGINESGDVVGFVLPVIFKNCAKEDLEEATIYDIGVVPEYRGLGFANDLLLQGTRMLQDIGVWRIFCDTDVNNVRMISTFKRVGYRQYGERWERPI
ncbi:GNAT family N-acetyltransferase [Leptolyngbya sp. FACHB-261]|uniref:GNAT family N-acetyltransferase n=1 Tax=Leptolyngbya sp. FACHB-261 TaxID=2692806 RepID=UPI001683A11C|nr:N-acetyltransferase [Leptolyngbya sp. FACHB-261]MBD2102506.1 GNAT family N-acetyltransferase [Leptolyngbya sp. FACHB-261]